MTSKTVSVIVIVVICLVGGLSFTVGTSGKAPSMEAIDLALTTTVTELTTSFYRTAVFAETWERLALNLSVQNLGDEVDQIGVHVVLNGITTTTSFSQYQSTLGLSRAVVYQFSAPQTLVIPLNHTPQSFYEIEITLTLDYGIQLQTPSIDLRILQTELIGIRSVVATEPVPVEIPVLSSRHNYLLPGKTTTSSFTRTRLLARLFLAIELDPSAEALQCNISVTMDGWNFKSVAIGGTTHSPETSVNSLIFEQTLVFSAETPLYVLDVLVIPETTTQEALTPVSISFDIRGYQVPRSDILPSLTLPPHPIPAPVMFLVLLGVLFGVPIWYVFNENLVNTPEDVIDTKTDKKI